MRFKYAKCVGMSPKADIGDDGWDVHFVPISAASHPSFVRLLSYKREMPTERSIVPRNELAVRSGMRDRAAHKVRRYCYGQFVRSLPRQNRNLAAW